MGVCCVDGCEPSDKEDVTYFPFPIKPALRRKWRDAIKTSTKIHTDSKICSKHFNEGDYERVRGKLRLKGKVVPSLFDDVTNNVQRSPRSPSQNNVAPTSVNSTDAAANDTDPCRTGVNTTDAAMADSDQYKTVDNSIDETMQYAVPDFAMTEAIERMDDHDDSAENCTIECVPEAILNHDSDSHSETELHKEDIEDIIANYHIKQNKKLADRLKPTPENEIIDSAPLASDKDKTQEITEKTANSNQDSKSADDSGKSAENSEKSPENSGKSAENSGKSAENSGKVTENSGNVTENSGKSAENSEKSVENSGKSAESSEKIDIIIDCDKPEDSDDCILLKEKEPEFIEISVDAAGPNYNESSPTSPRDCFMLLENVQVDIDPSSLMLPDLEPDDEKKPDPISLLTSSDDDDVILEEPHIDTVEVSSETDEDDMPLVKLVKAKKKDVPLTKLLKAKKKQEKKISRILWGKLSEFYCFECQFTTNSANALRKHRLEHSTSKVLLVCQICNFTSASRGTFARHKKKHREEKRFKCHLCEYRARHNMSLIYHLKSHEGVTVETVQVHERTVISDVVKCSFKCNDCVFKTNEKKDMLKHVKVCSGTAQIHRCDSCTYATKRKSDLRRHKSRLHVKKDMDDSEPPNNDIPNDNLTKICD